MNDSEFKDTACGISSCATSSGMIACCGRHAERGAEAVEPDTCEQEPGRHRVGQRERAEPSRDERLPRLGGDDEAPTVEHVGERAGVQREHERRDGRRGGQQRHESGRTGELDHQPAGGDPLHPNAQIGHEVLRRRPCT